MWGPRFTLFHDRIVLAAETDLHCTFSLLLDTEQLLYIHHIIFAEIFLLAIESLWLLASVYMDEVSALHSSLNALLLVPLLATLWPLQVTKAHFRGPGPALNSEVWTTEYRIGAWLERRLKPV